MKKLVALALSLILTLTLFTACGASGSASDLEKLQEKGTMIIGITEYEPMDYRDENGEWIGFDADLARAVCAQLGVEPEFLVLSDWGQRFYELKTGNIDAIWNGLTITDEVRLNTSVTDPYARNAQVVVMKADRVADFPDAGSLKALSFAVESGSAAEALAEDLGLTDLIALQDQTSAVMEVAAGTSDACIVDITLANAMVGEGTGYPDLRQGLSLSEEEYGIGFRRESDLTAKVNEILKALAADGTLEKLAGQYSIALAK